MAETTEPVILSKGLIKKYGRQTILKGVDLSIPPGVIYALLGTNGAGKTTFIRTILGLMPHSAGKIEILGEDPWQAGPALRQRIGYVSEEQGLYGWMKVSQLINFCKGLYHHWNQELVDKYLQKFGLSPDKRIRTMSKGQKVRLALILALAPEPELLILDEPMSGLDPLAQHEFLQIIKQDAKTMGHTIFFSTHDLPDVENIATHVAILYNGTVQISGPIEEVRKSVCRLRVPADQTVQAPAGAVLLEQENAFATYLVPDLPGNEAAASGVSGDFKLEAATLQEVFLYFCTRRDENETSRTLAI